MEVIKEKPKVIVSEVLKQEQSFFNVDHQNVHILFSHLRKTLYSDPILASLREYSTNAIDANIENGKPDEPIEITLPTTYDLILKIRDFGKGLSEEQIRKIYTSYGASTKRDSNDYHGQLGIGSKSAFAYTNSFTITSYYGGMCTIYEAFIDSTEVGAITKLSSTPSNEKTGLLISIPVKLVDIRLFLDKAANFFRFFRVIPKFLGNPLTVSKTPIVDELKDKTAFITQSIGQNICRMGDIPYPIDYNINELRKYSEIANAQIVFNPKIGEVENNLSREGLQYSKRTIKWLVDAHESVLSHMKGIILDKFKNCKCYQDILIIQNSLISTLRAFRFDELLGFNFNGKKYQIRINWSPVVNYSYNYDSTIKDAKTNFSISKYTKRWGNVTLDKYANSIDYREPFVFYENDLNYNNKEIIARVETLYETLNDKTPVFVVNFNGCKELKKSFIEKTLFNFDIIKPLSTIAKKPPVKLDIKESKNSHFGYVLKPNSNYFYSDNWEKEKIKSRDIKYYCIIDHFIPRIRNTYEKGGDTYAYRNAMLILDQQLGVDILGSKASTFKFYGIKRAYEPKIDKTKQTDIFEFFGQKILDYAVKSLQSGKISIDQLVTQSSPTVPSIISDVFDSSLLRTYDLVKTLPSQSEYREYVLKLKEISLETEKLHKLKQNVSVKNATQNSNLISLLNFFITNWQDKLLKTVNNVNSNNNNNIQILITNLEDSHKEKEKLKINIKKRYPLIDKYISREMLYSGDSRQDAIDYVKLVDK